MGIGHICFTDHLDLPNWFPVERYYEYIPELKAKYEGKIYIGYGLEVGYTRDTADACCEIVQKYSPEYIINSIHSVYGADCYFSEYFDGKSEQYAYERYLDCVEESLDAPYPYHTVGHFGYVCRNSPYSYRNFCDKMSVRIDGILRKIISEEKILELNTSVCKLPTVTVPMDEIFRRYVKLGGRSVCFSSDAHTVEKMGYNYDKVRESAASCGITEQTVVENGKVIQIAF